MPESGSSGAGSDHFAILFQGHANAGQVDVTRIDTLLAEHESSGRGVVRHGVLDANLPVANPRVDDLETRHHVGGGPQNVGHGDTRAPQVILEHEGDLAFGLGGYQAVESNGRPVGIEHVRQQVTEVRLIDPKHVHHHLAGDADLLSDHPLPGIEARLDHRQLHLIGLGQGHFRVGLGQWRHSLALTQCLVQLLADALNILIVHGALLTVARKRCAARCRTPGNAPHPRGRCPTAWRRRRRCAGPAGTMS
ncbi:hypothetical protein D9M70_369670 [compost metagenome]